MLKNILIISSDHTGHGHKSITEALCEKFAEYEAVNVHVVDGFSLGGRVLFKVGKSYGPVTRNAKELWELTWNISLKSPEFINKMVGSFIADNLLQLLKEVQPDLIISVHPNFVGSVLNILERRKIPIPFVALIVDLVSLSPLWADARADYVICPTDEAKLKCLDLNVPEWKLKVLGFPVRAKFYKHREESIYGNKIIYGDDLHKDNFYSTDNPLKCLIMGGGEGAGNMGKIASVLLENDHLFVKIVAGRNTALKRRLEKTLAEKHVGRVEVYGFVNHIEDLMLSSDILFTRGSPNVIMEAVACNIPLVITGALPGQEEENPEYVLKYHLGVVCTSTKNIQKTIDDLLSNHAQKLNQIKKAQMRYRNPDVVTHIVDFILSIETALAAYRV